MVRVSVTSTATSRCLTDRRPGPRPGWLGLALYSQCRELIACIHLPPSSAPGGPGHSTTSSARVESLSEDSLLFDAGNGPLEAAAKKEPPKKGTGETRNSWRVASRPAGCAAWAEWGSGPAATPCRCARATWPRGLDPTSFLTLAPG